MGLMDALGRAAGSMAAGALSGWQTTLGKAGGPDEGSDRAPGGAREDTAATAPVPTEKADAPPKSLFFDPWSVLEQLGYKERATPMSYGTIDALVQTMPVVGSVIHKRVTQVASFSKVQPDRYGIGHRVRLRDPREKPSPASRKHCEAQQSFLQRTGVTDNPRGRDNFETFLKKITRDTLRYDQMSFEIVPNRKGEPAEFYATDAASMRLADSQRLGLDEDFDHDVRYVQIYDGMVINEFSQSDLCFGVRNAHTDMRLQGYGYSEIEMSLKAITGLLNGWDCNSRFFSQGSGAKGVLNFQGPIAESQLDKFRLQFYSMLSGVQNAWRTPIINSESVQWIPLQGMSNVDMEFSAWLDFLIKVVCSFYHMDPGEINFQYGNVGQANSLNQESNVEKVNDSRENGLRPLLDFLANCINTHIIWPINESFIFEFVGLEAATPAEIAALNTQRGASYMTVNELRAEEDKPPLPNGDIILNAAYLQASAMGQQGAQGGAPQDGQPQQGQLDVGTIRQLLTGAPMAPGAANVGQPGADAPADDMKADGNDDEGEPTENDDGDRFVQKSHKRGSILDITF